MTNLDAAEAPAKLTFSGAYQQKLRDGWLSDPAQRLAVSQLNQLLGVLKTPRGKTPRGLYLHGPVGRGKSQLLSLFMQHLDGVKARRTHMHQFMGEIHQRLHAIKKGDPIQISAREIAAETRVLGFDEFYITNIADAILLGRLFEHLFKHGVVIVATSNWPMDDLYLNGRNRKSFLPFLKLLQHHLQPIDLGDGRDYRMPQNPDWPLYLLTSPEAPATPHLQRLFDRIASGDDAEAPRGIEAAAFRGRTGWYRFADICEQPVGRQEYLNLVQHLDTLVIEGVPIFRQDYSDPALRLVTLIDICYERHRSVIISAEAYPAGLYIEGPIIQAFRRTASRLAEMQTWVSTAPPLP